MSFGNNLRILMARDRVNITQLSEQTGISRNTISSIYHEKSKRIDFNTIKTLCRFFKCTPNDLIVIDGKVKAAN